MTIKIVNKAGKIVSNSQNMRGIRDYAREHPVIYVLKYTVEEPVTFKSRVFFIFEDESVSIVDYQFAEGIDLFLNSRERSWGKPEKLSLESFWEVFSYVEINGRKPIEIIQMAINLVNDTRN